MGKFSELDIERQNAAAESWLLEMLGPTTVTAPNGEQVTIAATLSWMMNPEQTLRFELYIDGLPEPIVRVVAPQKCTEMASSAVEAFRDIMDRRRR